MFMTTKNGVRTLTVSPNANALKYAENSNSVTLRTKTIRDSICLIARNIGAAFLAQGEYGMAFVVRGNEDTEERIESLLAHASDYFQYASLPHQEKLVLKFGFAVRGERWSAFAHNFRREVALHSRAQQRMDAGDVPELYSGGTFPASGYSLMVMKHVSGPRLMDVWNAKSMSPRLQQEIRRVVYALWKRAGIAHADLHTNQIVRRTKSKIAIFDFGQSVILPKHVVSKLPHVEHPSTEFMVQVWKHTIEPHVDAALIKRSVHKYLPNGNFIASVSRHS